MTDSAWRDPARAADAALADSLGRAAATVRASRDLVRRMRELACEVTETKAEAADAVARARSFRAAAAVEPGPARPPPPVRPVL